MYSLYVETDYDFSLEYAGHLYTSRIISLELPSLADLDDITIYGAFGDKSNDGKSWEYREAIEAIKRNPDQVFSNIGGNRGVLWKPVKQRLMEVVNNKLTRTVTTEETIDVAKCPLCGSQVTATLDAGFSSGVLEGSFSCGKCDYVRRVEAAGDTQETAAWAAVVNWNTLVAELKQDLYICQQLRFIDDTVDAFKQASIKEQAKKLRNRIMKALVRGDV